MAAADSNQPPEHPAPSSRRARRQAENPQAGQADGARRPSPYDSTGRPAQPEPPRPSPYAPPAEPPRPASPQPTTVRRDQRRPAGTRPRNRRTAGAGLGVRLAETLDRRRNRRTLTFSQKVVGMTAVTGMLFTGAIITAGASNAEVPLARTSYSSKVRWAWSNDVSLGRTESSDQYAQAKVSGLRSREHYAAFLLRYTSRDNRILVAVSGTEWRIQPSGSRTITGRFAHSSNGHFRAEVKGQTVRILWNGKVITTQKLTRTYPGRAVVASIWQSSRRVSMRDLEASSLPTQTPPTSTTRSPSPRPSLPTSPPSPPSSPSSPSSSPSSPPPTTPTPTPIPTPTPTQPATTTTSPTQPASPTPTPTSPSPTSPSPTPTSPSPTPTTPSPTPTPTPTAPTPTPTTPSPSPTVPVPPPDGSKHWWSGAAGDDMASGAWERWRGSTAGIAGVWDDTKAAQTEVWSICGGQYKSWDKPLDLAMGAIYRSSGESWSAAARGAYDNRWTQVLTTMKKCWGSRDPGKLFIRFGHEMNLSNEWKVAAGEEQYYVETFRRLAGIRDQVFPGAKLVFSPNEDSASGSGDVRKLWPGKGANGKNYADVYAVDAYNWWPHVTTVSGFQDKINKVASNGAPVGIEKHRRFAESLGAPFAMSEWSNRAVATDGGGGGESPVFVQEYNTWLRSHGGDPSNPQPGQVLYDVHFNLWDEYQFWSDTSQPKTAEAYRKLSWGR